MHLPWQAYVLIMLVVAAFVIAWNTRKFRKQFGDRTTIEEVRSRHPDARFILAIQRRQIELESVRPPLAIA